MKSIRYLFVICALLFTNTLFAQGYYLEDDRTSKLSKAGRPSDVLSLGLGLGLDHGFLGLNLLAYPQKNIGVFLGAGYAMAGIGINGGIKLRLIESYPSTKISPYATAMYGYNTFIYVVGEPQLSKVFNGSTFGLGVDYRPKLRRGGYWTFGLLLPIRSPDVAKFTEELRVKHGVVFNTKLTPVAITIGYKFVLSSAGANL